MFDFFPRIFKIALLALVAAVFAFSAQPAKAAPAPYFGPMPGMVVLGQSALGFNLFEDRTNSFADEKAEAKQNLENLGCVTCEIFDTFAGATFQGMASIDSQASAHDVAVRHGRDTEGPGSAKTRSRNNTQANSN